MKTYRITFTGRKVGAIGIFDKHTETMRGEDQDGAELALYEKFEHIHILRITQIEEVDTMKKKLRDDITQADVIKLLNITAPEAQQMASYCRAKILSNVCCECPHFEPCQRVNDELMLHPMLNGKPNGCFFMSDLLYYMKKAGACLRSEAI